MNILYFCPMIGALSVRELMNAAGEKNQPFLFGIDFEMKRGFFVENPLSENFIRYDIKGRNNGQPTDSGTLPEKPFFRKENLDYEKYLKEFDIVYAGLAHGDTFLINLTERTPIETNFSFEQIFVLSHAPYKLLFPDRFVCFSPESFVRIENQTIHSYPMKGTIDATIEDAENKLLENYKEKCEHFTIVDLIRNDLNKIATEVSVSKFRYVESLKTNSGSILQTSSEITGKLKNDYSSHLGDIIFELLPAGSISGAPKTSTVEIIKKAESQNRGYYTGIFGYYDGKILESAVIIRFIEIENGRYFFRSGGGITINSLAEDEYREVAEKVYLPFLL
jgi:para-aminobenzoate synthetase component I